MTSVIAEPPPGVRAVAGSTSAATAGVEYVQRLTRRFRYDDLPWQEAQRAGLLWSPIRKPHENAADEHWLSRGTFADVPHPELDATLRYPVSKWISTRGSWAAGRRAPLLGEDDKLLRRRLAPRGRRKFKIRISNGPVVPWSARRLLAAATGHAARRRRPGGETLAGGGHDGTVRENWC